MTQLDLHNKENECNIIVDIGSDTTKCTIIENGKVISPKQIIRIGGNDFDAATTIAVGKERGVIISNSYAKNVKESFETNDVCNGILGLHIATKEFVRLDIPYSMIMPYYDEIIGKIISYIEEQVKESKIETPSVKTIYLIGGTSLTKGLREAVEQHTGIKTMIAPNPENVVVLGLDKMQRSSFKQYDVARTGCGMAGFKDSEIAPLFKEAVDIENICLPKSFEEEIESVGTPDVPRELLTMMYGQVRTLIDLLTELNKQEPIRDSDDAIKRLEELIERNVRYGDEFAFMALRTVWCLMNRYEQDGKKVDIEQMEKDMLSFHNFRMTDFSSIFYNYSVRKTIKYIQFLNEFRKYTNYETICDDLQTIPVSACSSNDPEYYYSFNQYTIWDIDRILSREWSNVTKDGRLDNELLEQVVFGRFYKMVAEHGLRETIRLAYDDVGCRSNIKVPKRQEEIIWGPAYYIDGKHIEKGCSDFRHGEWTDTSFEMDFAHEILERDENYVRIESSIQGELYLPRLDYSLPVYSRDMGKMYFDNQEEKVKFIEAHKPK